MSKLRTRSTRAIYPIRVHGARPNIILLVILALGLVRMVCMSTGMLLRRARLMVVVGPLLRVAAVRSGDAGTNGRVGRLW